jgi:hypothetical protein
MFDPRFLTKDRSKGHGAGARSMSAGPLTNDEREANYIKQNGAVWNFRFTPRQRRRLIHKAHKNGI